MSSRFSRPRVWDIPGWNLVGEFFALEFKEFSLSLRDVFVVFFAEINDVDAASGAFSLFSFFVTVVTMGVALAITLILMSVIPNV
ncbi:hypothetical protein Tco_0384660, partial [Tanacetum coccineum]